MNYLAVVIASGVSFVVGLIAGFAASEYLGLLLVRM